MIFIVLLVIVLVPLFWYISVYNSIKTYGIKVDESFANIDVALAKRYEVLTKLFEVAKGYAKYEKETLVAAIKVRNGMSLNEKEIAYTEIEKEYARFFAISESYPELKADKLFLKLQDAVFDTEEHLSAARRLYNSNVSHFNQRIETFPGNMVSGNMNVHTKKMLHFSDDEIQDVNLEW